MTNSSSNTKRIAQNTVILYIRMIVVTLISLYTSRIILKALGVDDFGLYNVVGGVVGLLAFLNVTMSKCTQRFLNVGMVEGVDSLEGVFASSITVHLLFSLLLLLLGETLGQWFLNTKVTIPNDRLIAANIVFQASILTCCVSIISIPYRAAVIAYEKMSFIAVVSIIDAILKLSIAFFLLYSPVDRLAWYGCLLVGIALLNFVMYFVYDKLKYPSLKFRISFDKMNFKRIFSFVSWSLIGESAVVICNQGNVILVNMFHSLTANAAMTIGSQINHSITNLTANFQTAFNPQITKSYAEHNWDYLKRLVYSTSKISFCILFVVTLPIAFNIDFVLDVWLDTVPILSNSFAILFMVNGIINALSAPFHFVTLASGKIRVFQIVSALVFLSDIPIVYALFKMGLPPTTVMWVKIGTIVAILFIRIYFASKNVPSIHMQSYFTSTLLPIVCVSSFSLFVFYLFNRLASSFYSRIIFTVLLILVSAVALWLICLNHNERRLVMNIVRKKKE